MLKRLYVDNFRCLQNFEVCFDDVIVLLGRNGTGKTSVFDVLWRIQKLVVRGAKVDEVFPAHDLSTSQRRRQQRFELDTQSGDDKFRYELVVDHALERERMRILQETLTHNDHPVFEFQEGDAQLYRDSYEKGPQGSV